MNKSVDVKDNFPCASKKGLRIKVYGVTLDENNVLQAMNIEYSGLHCRGGAIVEVSQRNKIDLPEE